MLLKKYGNFISLLFHAFVVIKMFFFFRCYELSFKRTKK